jgi:hypothetical protein
MIKEGDDPASILELINSSNLPKRLAESLRFLAARSITSTIQSRQQSNRKDSAQSTSSAERMLIGRSLLAPLLYTFYKRLFTRLATSSVDDTKPLDIFFLSREGYLLKKGFDRIAKMRDLRGLFCSHYLMVSRVMLSKAAFHLSESHNIIARHQFNGSFKSFLASRLGVSEDEISAIALKHPFLNKRYHFDGHLEACRVAAEELDLRGESEIYLEYLKASGFTRSNLKIVVDLGYSGTIQDLLSLIVHGGIRGYYLITTPAATSSAGISKKNDKHGLVASGVSWGSCALLDKSILLETLLTSPQGTCLGIKKVNQEFTFIHGPKCSTQHRFDEVEDIFDNAMDHVICMFEQGIEDLDYQSLSALYSGVVSSSCFRNPESCLASLLEIEDKYSGNDLLNVNQIINQ